MSNQVVRYVNLIPASKIKKEIEDDDNDESLSCSICSKSFANEVAIRNHLRMEHIDALVMADPAELIVRPEPSKEVKAKLKEEQKKIIKQKTEALIASMAPTNLMSLASEDVNYIIIKSENIEEVTRKRKKSVEKPATTRKVDKEARPITGPFECLQPSNLVADGTCHQIFFSCCEYSTHFRDEHTRRRKGLRCQVCEKPLNPNGDECLSPFACEICGIGFQTNKELTEHTNTAHIKLKPFQCTICNKRFTQQGGVQQHMRMHTGDRPFPCTYCPKAFTQKSGLDQHLRIHTKSKPYRCIICSKTFCQSVHLKQHMRTHTNVAPFQCGICDKRFKQSSHLNYHLRGHNSANMTEVQKKKYSELMGMIEGKPEMIEVELEQMQGEIPVETEIAVEDIQEELVEQAYTLKDNGDNTWSVKIID